MPSQPSENETRRDWELIQENATDRTERLKIKGGYLYRTSTNTGQAVGLVFVAD
jgi:hypothetical protein